MEVFKAISAVQAALAKVGISKSRRNEAQKFWFRGVDDVYGTLAPLLAEHRLLMLPRILSRQCDVRETTKGSTLYFVTLECEFDFVSAEDGSKHTIRTFGEAMDSADKATNKAMSAAYKYAAIMAFAIPIEGEPDADADGTDEEAEDPASPDLRNRAMNEARKGIDAYAKFWKEISAEERKAIGPKRHEDLKALAAEVKSDAAA